MPEEMGGAAVIEAPEASEAVETGAESVETSIEGTESTETGAEQPNSEQTEQKPAAGARINLKDALKKNAAAIKAIDPGLATEMQSAVFRLGGFEKEFPGGLKEARELKAVIGEIGGAEGIRETREAVSEYQKLEGLFEKGDGQFFGLLADASPQAFSSLMPSGLETWKAKDPDGYNHTLAQVMVQTLDGARFSDTLASIWERLPEDAASKPLKDALASLWQTVDGYRKVAEKAPEKKVSPQDEALTKREQELATRERQAFMAPIATSGKQHVQQIVDAEMARGYQWNATSQDVQQAVRERVTREIVEASKKDKTFMRDFERYQERGDASGLERHIKNFQQRVGPGIVEKVARLFNVKPKGAGAGPVKVQPQKPGAQTTRVGTMEWAQVGKQPSPAEVDRVRTTADMILDNRAILKSGKRVTWA